MKASLIHAYGGPEVLRFGDYPDPVAEPGEALIRVAAASINPVDTFERAGLMQDHKPMSFPGILGWDVSGTVVGLGPGVSGFAVGDKVIAWAYHTYAELCAVNADRMVKLPDGLDLVEAAALPLVTTAGSQLISVASGITPGQSVLVAGAMGGVGRSAVFTAKDRGAVVIAGVLRKQLADAEALGADKLVALDDETAMRTLAPVDVVANAVRGRTAERLLGKLKPDGVFASVTGAPDNAADYPSVRIVSFVSKPDPTTLRVMAQAVREGRLVIPIDRKLPLQDAAAGHQAVETGGIGKVLLLAS